MAISKAYCMDCLEAMREMPDNAFDLAIVDPPYGNVDGDLSNGGTHFGGHFDSYRHPTTAERIGGGRWAKFGKRQIEWDITPPDEYFEQLFRVSKNQIIWGGITSDCRQPAVF